MKHYVEIGELLNLQEIETASNNFKICPKCNSAEGFWLGLKRDHAYVQCKSCGAKFELFEVYKIGEKSRTPERLRFIRK
jgi:transcription elongation factor Elf1